MKRERAADEESKRLSRRSFLKGAGGAAAGGVLASELASAEPGSRASKPEPFETLEGQVRVRFRLNAEEVELDVEPRTTLLSALRDRLGHTSAKSVCELGSCGACTVLVDDEPVYSCLTLAVRAQGREVRTAGGLAEGGELSPVQQAMVEHDGMMCGFCTPGFVMSVTACLEKNPHATDSQVRSACSGNLCRCGTYPHVFQAAGGR
jgi:aerobic-type carbon monoxide dehydrogenase small subunit (CoxS/CutS family)